MIEFRFDLLMAAQTGRCRRRQKSDSLAQMDKDTINAVPKTEVRHFELQND